MLQANRITGVDPGFLERGFKCIKVCVCVCVLGGGGGGGETKLFHYHRIFQNGGMEGGSSEPPKPPLDPPLNNN